MKQKMLHQVTVNKQVIQTCIQLIRSNGGFIQKQRKWLYECLYEWVTELFTTQLKNFHSYSNKTLLCVAWKDNWITD